MRGGGGGAVGARPEAIGRSSARGGGAAERGLLAGISPPRPPPHAWVFVSLLFSMNFRIRAGTFHRPETRAVKRRPSPCREWSRVSGEAVTAFPARLGGEERRLGRVCAAKWELVARVGVQPPMQTLRGTGRCSASPA